MYKYFISYSYKSNLGAGFGYCSVNTNKKIESFKHLEDIAKEIKENSKCNEVIILNYKLLRKENLGGKNNE